ncbi:MAG: lactate racemase domain-containing protein [Candidatus Marinimicrobia bacterium]|jgi:nickel-dependent lactate racemase|nr:lactate racemase domain-containing protein [Candidatus Neomarinimicrobiota bacterium]MCK9559353.1 lactate racemase domain-containing protein [Candidatus Neomarinimicrobiota bacterium]
MLFCSRSSVNQGLTETEIREGLYTALEKIGNRRKVLAIPPDFTRFHSRAGELTQMAYQYYHSNLTAILPALGTHFPMSDFEIQKMFGNLPRNLFRIHRWKEDLVTLGEVPGEFVRDVSEGRLDYAWPAQVNKLLVEGGFDLILSIGQVVPHEVVGMANYNKNILVGTGGQEGINKSHFLGAVYGMERIMGRADTPVRRVLNYASENFARQMSIVYVLTVIGKDAAGRLSMQGLFIGDDYECFRQASELSLRVNFEILEKPLKKVVVWLDPQEFKSTWLGNKSIYRTRMAIADGGELIVLAPGLREFGEDADIDRLIRKYGYRTTPEVLRFVDENADLQNNLSAAAHLIHGSSENRFTITYCPGHISRKEIESVNFNYGELAAMLKRYDLKKLTDGFNVLPDGEEIFFISNPALGLWSTKERFNDN